MFLIVKVSVSIENWTSDLSLIRKVRSTFASWYVAVIVHRPDGNSWFVSIDVSVFDVVVCWIVFFLRASEAEIWTSALSGVSSSSRITWNVMVSPGGYSSGLRPEMSIEYAAVSEMERTRIRKSCGKNGVLFLMRVLAWHSI